MQFLCNSYVVSSVLLTEPIGLALPCQVCQVAVDSGAPSFRRKFSLWIDHIQMTLRCWKNDENNHMANGMG